MTDTNKERAEFEAWYASQSDAPAAITQEADAALRALADRIEEAQGRAICISVEGADYLRNALAASAPVAPLQPGEYLPLPVPSGRIEYPAQRYEDAWVSTQDAYSEEQMHAYVDADRAARGAAQAAPTKMPIPPPPADPLDVVYAEAWNAACEAFFGGKPPADALVITVTKAAPVAPAPQPITAAEQAAWHAGLDEGRSQARGAAQAAPAEDDKWRSLALQFDSHRMQALSHLKLLLECGEDHADAVRTFLAGPPLDGESVLAQRIAAYAQPAPVAEDAEIRKALHDAATSLETISRIAGRDRYMLGMMDVRLYAAARAKVAREAQAAQPEGGAK